MTTILDREETIARELREHFAQYSKVNGQTMVVVTAKEVMAHFGSSLEVAVHSLKKADFWQARPDLRWRCLFGVPTLDLTGDNALEAELASPSLRRS